MRPPPPRVKIAAAGTYHFDCGGGERKQLVRNCSGKSASKSDPNGDAGGGGGGGGRRFLVKFVLISLLIVVICVFCGLGGLGGGGGLASKQSLFLLISASL